MYISNCRERRLQFIDSRTIMMWNERETMTFVSNGAEEFYFNNDMITVTSYGRVMRNVWLSKVESAIFMNFFAHRFYIC